MSRIIVVVGATGQQGGSVVRSLLEDAELKQRYQIRGTTRDANSQKAQVLTNKGVEMVEADINIPATFENAFAGAHVIFANTVTIYDGHAYEHELTHGRTLADAAVAARVPFIIYSTLPNGNKTSAGKFKNMGHFDGKEAAQQYIRTLPIRSAFIAPGAFMSNFHASMAPHPVGDGTYAWTTPASPDTKLPLLDAAKDTGKWVINILRDFDRYEGKITPCATVLYSMQECCEAMTRASGKTIVYYQVGEEVFRKFLPPNMVDHITEMLLYFQEFGYYGEDTEGKVQKAAGQVKGLTTFKEYLRDNPLQLKQGGYAAIEQDM